jgi:hypothetical protein
MCPRFFAVFVNTGSRATPDSGSALRTSAGRLSFVAAEQRPSFAQLDVDGTTIPAGTFHDLTIFLPIPGNWNHELAAILRSQFVSLTTAAFLPRVTSIRFALMSPQRPSLEI